MTMRMKLCKTIALIMVLIETIASLSIPAFAAEKDERKTIRVAYPIQEGVTDIDEDGNYTGYTFEYLEKIAQNTGWHYEYVTVPGTLNEQLEALMKMVENGEVDLMGGMVYSEAADDIFTYCRNKYGTAHTVLQILKDSRYNSGQKKGVSDENPMRIAISSTTGQMSREVTEYCERTNMNFVFVECESLERGIALLKEDKADALASSEMFVREELQIIAGFAPKPFYFVTGKGTDTSLMQKLDTAIINIKRYDPTYQQELYSKYFSPYANNLSLSQWEREYIASLPPLKIGMDSNRPPFQHYVSEKGWHGIGIDILDYISEQTGIQFELVDVPGREEQYIALQNDELDMILGVPYDYAFAREYDVILSEPYLVQSIVLVTGKREFDLGGVVNAKVALVEHSYTTKQDLPTNVLTYASTYDCLQAVADGDADCTYLNQLSAQYYLNDPEFFRLKIATFDRRESSLSLAMRTETDPVLLNIINRSISTMTSEFQNAVVFKHLSADHEITLQQYFQENPMAIVLLLCTVVALIALMATHYVRRRAKEAKLTKMRLDKHLNLCSLAGDIFVEYDFKTNHLMASCPDNKHKNHAEFFEVDLMTSEDYRKNKAAVDAFVNILKGGTSEPIEIQLPFFDGSKHWAELTVSKMYDEENDPVYSLARLKLIDEKFTEQEVLRHQAQRDGLTQLYNIGHFTQLVKERLKSFSDGQTDALVIIDIDYFKSVNDTYGHMVGNEMLQKVAFMLKRVCPKSSMIARMGGDEFVIYLTHVGNLGEVETLCRTLCEEARKISLSKEKHLSLSIGVTVMEKPTEQKAAFEKADVALYDVKRNGRDGYKLISL